MLIGVLVLLNPAIRQLHYPATGVVVIVVIDVHAVNGTVSFRNAAVDVEFLEAHFGLCVIDEAGGYNLIGIRFRKGGVYPFFDFPIVEIDAKVIALDLIWGSLVNEIREKLSETENFAERFELLERILLSKMRKVIDQRAHNMIQYSLSFLENYSEEVRIAELVNGTGMSHKHFLRKFESMIGLSPKVLRRSTAFKGRSI